MPELSFVTLDVFTQRRFAGNPLAVVSIPNGQDVTTEQMQEIAREFNLSETVFLHEGSKTGNGLTEWRVRIFMTDHELPFAGHPTIGTACYALGTLANNASKGRLLCKAGPIEVDYGSGLAKASIPHNVHIHKQAVFSEEDVYRLQPNLSGKALGGIDIVSPVKGMTFVCVGLLDLETLGLVETTGVKPMPQLDDEWNFGFAGSYFYVHTGESRVDGDRKVQLRTRMLEGTLEDPATGSAACALSALLAMKRKKSKVSFEITQAVEMGRQSDIGVCVALNGDRASVKSIELSGSSVRVMSGSVQFD